MASTGAIRAGGAYVELFLKNNQLNKGLTASQKQLQSWGKTVTGVGTKTLAAGLALRAPFAAALKIAADMGSELVDMRAKTGVSVEALSELGYAAQVSGSDLESLQGALSKSQKKIGEAFSGSDTAIQSFADIKVSVNELKALSPDQQFERLADAIADIDDPAKRTAAAMDIFGKSGANLLPLLTEGGDGIRAMRAEAHRLGLVINTEDAEAAESFGDQLDTLFKQLKAAAFAIGSALIPAASKLAKKISDVAAQTIAWLRENKDAVIWFVKMTGVVIGVGAALVGVGYAFTTLGAIIGAGMAAVAGFGSVIGIAGSALGMLLSPIGLVVAAVVGLGAYFIVASGQIGKAMDWLRGNWEILKDDATKAFQGIKDALSAGDFKLAAQILWLSLQLVFTRGIGYLKGKWQEFKLFFQRVWTEAVFGAAEISIKAWAGIQKGWSETTGFLADTWTVFTSMLTRTWNSAVGFIKKAWERLKGFFGADVDVEARVKEINEETARENKASQDAQDKQIMDGENARKKRGKDIEGDRSGALGNLDQGHKKAIADLGTSHEASVAELEEKLKAIQAERDALLAKAKGGADEAAKNRLGELDGKETDIKKRLLGAGDDVDAQKEKKIQGTFSAAAAVRFGKGGDKQQEIADATKQTAKNTKELKDKLKPGMTADNS